MAIGRTAGGTGRVNTGSDTAVNLTPAATIPAGSLVLLAGNAHYVTAPGAITVSASDTQGNSYTTRITRGYATHASPTSFGFIIEAPAIARALSTFDAITVTVSSPAECIDALLTYDSGMAAAPFDVSAQADSGGVTGTAAASGATPGTSVVAEFIWGIICENGGTSTITPGAGWSAGQSSQGHNSAGGGQHGVFELYQIVSATGSFDATATLGTVGYWTALCVTYQGAAVVASRDVTADGATQAPSARDVGTDADLQVLPERDVTADAALTVPPLSRDVISDADISTDQVATERSVLSDAAAVAPVAGDVTAQAVALAQGARTLATDAAIAAPVITLVTPFSAEVYVIEPVGSVAL